MFTFTVLDDVNRYVGTGRIQVPSLEKKPHDPVYCARFRGALLARFGAPLRTSSDADDAFEYQFMVSTEHDPAWILTAYEGPSGSAFGAIHPEREEAIAAATALLAILDATQPADFEAVIELDEYEDRVTYGCTDGICYYHSETK